jgi:eukaryotic-like serine/threonine-protein kinase
MPNDEVWIGNIPYVAKKFARGGMGFVVLLRRDDTRLPHPLGFTHGVDVAIKAFLPSDGDPTIRQLFQRELTVWAGLNHPTIVSLNEILRTKNDGLVAAMDRAVGSLEDLLVVHRMLSRDDAVFILNDVIQGLAYAASSHKIFHLDIKPANILYGHLLSRGMKHKGHPIQQYRWMVSDWGLASVKEAALAAAINNPSLGHQFQTFNQFGTEGYMAPERYAKGIRSSVASDVFSLGVILFRMLTGTPPFSQTELSVVDQVISHNYLSTAKKRLTEARIPRPIAETTLQMIDPVASNRFQDYEALRLRLLKCARSSESIFSRLFKI